MSDFSYDEEVRAVYEQQREKQFQEMSKMIVAYRTKIALLEKTISDYEKMPVPRTVVKQIVELEMKNRKLQEDLDFYKKHVPVQVLINRENKNKPTRRGGLR